MKVHTSKDGKRRIWFDPSAGTRAWVMQEVDAAGNQVGGVDYETCRAAAFVWLRGGTFEEMKEAFRRHVAG